MSDLLTDLFNETPREQPTTVFEMVVEDMERSRHYSELLYGEPMVPVAGRDYLQTAYKAALEQAVQLRAMIATRNPGPVQPDEAPAVADGWVCYDNRRRVYRAASDPSGPQELQWTTNVEEALVYTSPGYAKNSGGANMRGTGSRKGDIRIVHVYLSKVPHKGCGPLKWHVSKRHTETLVIQIRDQWYERS